MNAEFVVRAPGRVNLIGEHTDHQEGFVLPAAIGLGVELRARSRDDGELRLRSRALPGEAVVRADDDPARVVPEWARCPAAVGALLRRAGLRIRGLDADVGGDLPVGGGLSSSAALDVACALALIHAARTAGDAVPPALDDLAAVAVVCRDAEAMGSGVRCGIMDPFASLHGRADAALLLDCRTVVARAVPVPPGRFAFVVADSGVPRELAAGDYGRRRDECGEAARILGVRALRDATCDDVERRRTALGDVLHRRARHVATENDRVLAAAQALEAGDALTFGRLLDASHASLRDDFEVSCPEVDALVAAVRAVPGVLGARMTGGGFGGWIVAAVRPEAAPDVVVRSADAGARRLGRPVRALRVVPSPGARVERAA